MARSLIMDDNQKISVYQGPENIGGIGRYLADWLREKKRVESDFIVYTDHTNHQNAHENFRLDQTTFIFKILKKLKFFLFAIKKYDIFNFYFGKTLLPLNLDLIFLRLLRKKIVMTYVGSDIRLYKLESSRNPEYHLRKPKNIFDHFDHLKKLRMFWQSLWFDKCIANRDLYFHAAAVINKKKIIEDIWVCNSFDVPESFSISQYRDLPLIVHAPTHFATKGTIFVEKAVDNLRKRGYVFEFRLFHKTPSEEVKKVIKEKAAIVVDQLLSGGFGNLAVEAMSYGKPVCGYILEDLRTMIPELPIVQCTKDNLEEQLAFLLDHPEERERIGRKSHEFARVHFDRDVIFEKMWNLYLGLLQQ